MATNGSTGGWGWQDGSNFGRGGAWSPAQATGGGVTAAHWWRADLGTYAAAGGTAATADGAVVGQWQDQMAAADHLAASLAEWKPLLKLNIVNGYPVLRFDGSNDRLGGSFTNGGTMAQPLIMVMVAKLGTGLADNNTNYFLASTSGTADAQYYFQVSKQGATTPDKWDLNAGATIRSTAAADDVWNIWTMLLNGASSRLWHNGVLEASGNAGAATPNGLLIGGNFNGTSNWNGDVAEALLYAANLSDADKNQIGAYAAARYGLSYTNIA